MQLAFEITQRGQLPADSVARAIVEAHVRAGATLVHELAKNVSGGVVQRGRDSNRPSGRPHLADAIVSETTRLRAGEIQTLVGFDKRVAFIGRFLERGTKAHPIEPKRRRRRRGQATAPTRKRALAFVVGGQLVLVGRVPETHVDPHPIFGTTLANAEPIIRADFEQAIKKAING